MYLFIIIFKPVNFDVPTKYIVQFFQSKLILFKQMREKNYELKYMAWWQVVVQVF